MTYTTHVQPQRCQYSTNAATATATVEEEDSIDSEEEEDDYEAIKERTRPNLYPFNKVQPNRIQYHSKTAELAAAATIENDNSDDSEQSNNNDNKPFEEKPKQNLAILNAAKYGTKTLSSVRRTNYHSDEQESDGGSSNSDTKCSSETCESETNFQQLDAAVNSTSKRRGKSNEALKRNNNARKNSYWIKNEKKRKSNKYYKIALLGLNDSDISSILTGEDHQVR
jgi:hypothetical protein